MDVEVMTLGHSDIAELWKYRMVVVDIESLGLKSIEWRQVLAHISGSNGLLPKMNTQDVASLLVDDKDRILSEQDRELLVDFQEWTSTE